jgi:hypothetical protein
MSAIGKTLTATAAAAALLVSVAASAATATVSTELNMRTGPGTGYPVVQVLPRGAQVDANCSAGSSWCQVYYSGIPGYVSSRYLTTYAPPQTAYNPPTYTPPYNPPAYNPPAYNPPAYTPPATGQGVLGNIDPAILGLGAAVIGGVLGNAFGNGDDNDDDNNARNRDRDRDRDGRWRGRDRDRDQVVCFYEDFDYGGRQFCGEPGDRTRSLANGWNDRISSIRVSGGAQVQVCEDFEFGGQCRTINNDVRQMANFNDRISSFRVR